MKPSPKPDAANARARMNREARRKLERHLASSVGGKKRLREMLEEAKARAKEDDMTNANATDQSEQEPSAA